MHYESLSWSDHIIEHLLTPSHSATCVLCSGFCVTDAVGVHALGHKAYQHMQGIAGMRSAINEMVCFCVSATMNLCVIQMKQCDEEACLSYPCFIGSDNTDKGQQLTDGCARPTVDCHCRWP